MSGQKQATFSPTAFTATYLEAVKKGFVDELK
jgi:hypothetical protein